ncbi:MAG TPA: Ni/Fe-hydrogenase cytochrome b subunit [Solibacterales bacterium]|nr:Ni/Fe-hydrogenase cytochrome b subunit [Bryobacterales bacterium]
MRTGVTAPVKWQRGVAVDARVTTPAFYLLGALAAVGFVLSLWREFSGLGPATGLNDGYSWGLFKNFNVTTLTALGSGGYAVGVLAWLLNHKHYHVIMRTAVLTSLLGYGTGMVALTVDIGRPWNIVFIGAPWVWNPHSLLLEVALCMTAYLILGLSPENAPAVLDHLHYNRYPEWVKKTANAAYDVLKRIYPFAIALAFVLPSMHQAGLGALMMLAGPRLHPVWQTPLLPLFYLVMAWILGLSCVLLVLMISCLVWNRAMDMPILSSLARVTSSLALGWLWVRLGDLAWRGELAHAFTPDRFTLWFLDEFVLIAVPALALQKREWRENPVWLFRLLVLLTLGGMLYRFVPTTIAFMPGEHYHYFPSLAEILMSAGYAALAVLGYQVAVKKLAILPAPILHWRSMAGGAV